MTSPFLPLAFHRGPTWKNRFALAPMTNTQSFPDGKLSDDEKNWLRMRARGGFALTMTCASHVQRIGQGFPGQLGIFDDAHLPGLTELARALRSEGTVSSVQLHHAGMRSPAHLIGEAPVCPSNEPEFGARALSTEEVETLIEDFVRAAERADEAGFDGVELHGAHGYILCQFLSSEHNRRDDRYGGSLENRARPIFEIVEGIRARCRPDFQLGVRLSPERYGMKLAEMVELSYRLMQEGEIDYLDLSLWDSFKEPEEEAHRGRSLASWFTEVDRGDVRLGVAGKIRSGADVRRCLDEGFDFVLLGRAAILHHDFPARLRANPDFRQRDLPVSAEDLREEGLGEAFVTYMRRWEGFVS